MESISVLHKRIIMKKTSLFLLLALFATDQGLSQDAVQKLSQIENRIEKLEAQQMYMSQIKQSVNTQSGINYKILSASGELSSGTVLIDILATNETNNDIDVRYNGLPKIIYDDGRGLVLGWGQINVIFGSSRPIDGGKQTLIPGVPVSLKIYYIDQKKHSMIKVLDFKCRDDNSSHAFRFKDIPIKWE